MDNRRIPISVSVHPSEYAGRTIRLGNNGSSDIRDKMNSRMREFETESQKWREQFLSGSSLSSQPSLLENRPRMLVNFPDFPELSSGFSSPMNRIGSGSSFGAPSLAMAQTTSHKSFIEEDDHGKPILFFIDAWLNFWLIHYQLLINYQYLIKFKYYLIINTGSFFKLRYFSKF